MLEQIKSDLEQYKKIYITVQGYNGNIRVTREKLISANENVLKVKTGEGIIIIPIGKICYYEV